MKKWFVLLFLVVGCAQPEQKPVKLVGEAQGTYYSIIYYDNNQRNFQFEIDSLLRAFDRSLSLWVPNSILSRVNNNDTTAVLDRSFEDNFNLSMQVAEKTGGDFDVTVGPLVRAWGFGFDGRRHVDDSVIDSLMQITGYHKIHLIDHTVRCGKSGLRNPPGTRMTRET